MRPFLDLNVLLDHYLSRAPWDADANAIFRAAQAWLFKPVVAAHSITTLFYVTRRPLGEAGAYAAVDECLALFDVAPVSGSTLKLSRTYPGVDFEDHVQKASAVEAQAERIVTRDRTGFANSPLPVESPADFVARLGLP